MNFKELANNLFNDVVDEKTYHPVQQYHRGGKGRKQCPICKAYVGVRTKVCQCSHLFEFSDTTNKKENVVDEVIVTEEDRRYAVAIGANSGTFTYVGSGSPLGKVYGISVERPESVLNFCEDIVAFGIKNNRIYLPSAIKNFLRHTIEECEKVFHIVDDWYNQKLLSVADVNLENENET
jgi:hypothetical protein